MMTGEKHFVIGSETPLINPGFGQVEIFNNQVRV